MSSFHNPHHMFLFALRNGKKKLGYGITPDDAYENLKLRLSAKELAEVVRENYQRITQRQLREHIRALG